MALAPVALFIYRRPEHVRRTLAALRACKELADSPITIYCDGPKTPDAAASVSEARRVAHALAPSHARFVERDANLGLAKSIIGGVSELTNEHGKVIVVEDDLDVAPTFLQFLNLGLERYADDERVMQVSGYQFPVEASPKACFMSFPTSWGWATWKRAWAHFDEAATGYAALKSDPALRKRFDLDGSYPYFAMLEQQLRGEVDSWAIRWHLSVFMRQGLVLYPGKTLVRNTGFDGSGTHIAAGGGFVSEDVRSVEVSSELPTVAVDAEAERRVLEFLASQRSAVSRIKAFASKWTRGALANPNVPAPVRALASRMLGRIADDGAQDLDLYWDPKMAEILDTWGTDNAWNEIQMFLANARGKVIDIACGTGKVMTLLDRYPGIEVHGFDISDFLIGKAIERGLPRDRLTVADATATPYADDQFDYGYSIGSLEHFTEDGITKFVREAHRITRYASMHMIPVSRSGRDEGWLKTHQSFHNNSVDWWLAHYRTAYDRVHVLESAWNDKISVGKWFLCTKQDR
jgi:ubiquinone/menaquinone biosynthesis C-methylase UbiE